MGTEWRKGNICWDCENACGDCSWSEIDVDTKRPRFEPVPGWTAEEVLLNMGKGRIVQSYRITACPQFRPDAPATRGQKRVSGRYMTIAQLEELISKLMGEGVLDDV